MGDVLINRMRPQLDPLVEFFWVSGEDGRLRFQRCRECSAYQHPPAPRCRRCLSSDVLAHPVSGFGSVHTFTVNHQQWTPGQPPYVVAVVRLDEQDDLQLTTNVVGCEPGAVGIGMRVRVRFLHRNDVWYPLFEPVEGVA